MVPSSPSLSANVKEPPMRYLGRFVGGLRVARLLALLAPAAFLGFLLTPLAHADEETTLEADLLSLIPLPTASDLFASPDSSVDPAILTNAYDYLGDAYGTFGVAVLSNAEFAPEINDSLQVIGDLEGAVSDIAGVAGDGLSLADLITTAATS